MAPTFFLIVGGIFFALLCIPCLLVLALGTALRSKVLKQIGSIALFVSAGFVGVSVLGFCYIVAMESLTQLIGPPTRTAPHVQGLVGTYRLTSRSVRFVERKGYADLPDMCIILRADGTFEMKNMPDMWMNFGRAKRCFDSGSGTWELDSRDAGLATLWGITLDFDDIQGFTSQVHKNGFVYSMLELKNQCPPYLIHVTIGDADGSEALEFERVSARPEAKITGNGERTP